MTLDRIIVLLALGVVGCTPSPSDAPASATTPVAVTTARVTADPMASQYEAGGIVRARSTAVIASRVTATVAAVHVRPGDRVREGDEIVALDRRDRQAEANRQTAAVGAARESRAAADAERKAMAAEAAMARLTYDRLKALHDRRSATTEELDRAATDRDRANAALDGAEARHRAADASLSAAVSAAAAADVGLSDTTLAAPFAALVTERRIDPGTLAVAGTPLLMLDSLDGARLEVDLDEARALMLRVGQPVAARVDALTDTWSAATIAEVGRVDPTTHAFRVKVDLPSSIHAPAGSFGRVRFPGAPRPTISVPAAAVVRRSQLTFVFRIDDEGRARLTPVTVGDTVDGRTEILAGPPAGDLVVVAPPLSLADGAPTSQTGGRP